MGFNTTVVVMNDALGTIKDDPEFGKELASAISKAACFGKHQDVPAETQTAGGGRSVYSNAATVVASDHADVRRLLLTGENTMEDLGIVWPYGEGNLELRVLKALANRLGYYVAKLPKE